jgi:RNA polymerase sigma-70 factor (ECF subfamily)
MEREARAADVARVSEGDPDALQRLIIEYHAHLRRAVDAGVSRQLRSRIDPDDILQQTYVVAFRSVKERRFEGPGAFYKWLEAIALSRLRDEERALRRRKRDVGREVSVSWRSGQSIPALCDRLTGADATPSRKLAREEAIAAVMSGLARLSEDQRVVVRERFLHGCSVPEIAQRLGKTEGAIHMLCHRGLKALREQMVSLTRYLSRL